VTEMGRDDSTLRAPPPSSEFIMITLNVNNQNHEVDADGSTPLLYVLRDDLGLHGAKFGCGLGQCGACTVLLDMKPVFSCIAPIAALQGRRVITLEGLGTLDNPGLLQRAFIAEQAAQCGYCIPGMIMRAHALLQVKASPSDSEIREHMRPNLCRCGTHMRIIAAVRRAASAMRSAAANANGEEVRR
jgi:nicotinate dehydrogenase subunit A